MTSNYWLLLAAACVVVEILPPATHFFCLCFVFGAVGGAIAAVYGCAIWIQWLVFIATSVALIPLLVPLAKFLFASSKQVSSAAVVSADPLDVKK